MKHLLLVSLIITTLTSQGQNKVQFKTYFKPNKVYQTTLNSSSQSEISFTGQSQATNKEYVKGTKPPTHISNSNKMTIVEKTGDYAKNGNIPVEIAYGKVITKKKLNGKETSEEESYSNLLIEGVYTKRNELRIDSMFSDKLDKVAQRTLKYTLESLQSKIKFPKYGLGVGESFDQKLPIQIPLAGLKPVNLVINIHYKLVAIKNGKAIFNISQTVVSGVSNEGISSLVTGQGTGITEYDIADNFITRYDSNLTLFLKIVTNDVLVNANIQFQSSQLVVIESATALAMISKY